MYKLLDSRLSVFERHEPLNLEDIVTVLDLHTCELTKMSVKDAYEIGTDSVKDLEYTIATPSQCIRYIKSILGGRIYANEDAKYLYFDSDRVLYCGVYGGGIYDKNIIVWCKDKKVIDLHCVFNERWEYNFKCGIIWAERIGRVYRVVYNMWYRNNSFRAIYIYVSLLFTLNEFLGVETIWYKVKGDYKMNIDNKCILKDGVAAKIRLVSPIESRFDFRSEFGDFDMV